MCDKRGSLGTVPQYALKYIAEVISETFALLFEDSIGKVSFLKY